jgi:hypothetical protein
MKTSLYYLLGDAGFARCTPELNSPSARLPRVTEQLARRPYSRWWLAGPLIQVSII